jgi:hypothetical protein
MLRRTRKEPMWKSESSATRAVALLLAAAVVFTGCGDSTAPETTYTLVSINGTPLTAPTYPGSGMLVTGATLTLYPDGRAVSRVQGKCAPLPPDGLCDANREFVHNGTYSSEAASLTFEFEDPNHVAFGPDGPTVTFATGFYGVGGPNVWRYRR